MRNSTARIILNIVLIISILSLFAGAYVFDKLESRIAIASSNNENEPMSDETAALVEQEVILTTKAGLVAITSPNADASKSEKYSSLYNKLKNKQNIRILLAGDSIALSEGASSRESRWQELLIAKLKEKYQIGIVLDEMTQRNDTAFGGLINYLEKMDSVYAGQYDLIILCYGPQDMIRYSPESYSKIYEALIKKLKSSSKDAEIAIIAANTMYKLVYRDLTKSIAEHYNTLYTDMVTYIHKNGVTASESDLFRFPGDEEYKLYANSIFQIVTEACDQNKRVANLDKKSLNTGLEVYYDLKNVDQFPFKKGFDTSVEYSGRSFIESSGSGDIAEADFKGSICGLSVLANKNGGIARVFIDGLLIREIDCYSPVTVIRNVPVALELTNGQHRLRIEVAGTSNRLSSGTGIAIHSIITN